MSVPLVKVTSRGVIVLSKRPSKIDEMVDELRDSLLAKGTTLESMLRQLREMRETEDA